MNKLKNYYILNAFRLITQIIWLNIPVFLFINLKYFPTGTSYIEKYLIIQFINTSIFLVIFRKKNQNYLVQNFQFTILIFYNLAYTKLIYFDNNLFYIQNSEPSIVVNLAFILSSFYLVEKNFNKNKILMIQFIFFLAIFHIEILGIYLIFLYFKYKFEFNFSKSEFLLFKSIPIAILFLRFIFSLSKNFNIFWYSLIRKPYSGSTRFYDMQWNLLNIKCNSGNTSGDYLFFGSFMECPETYSPMYNLIVLDLKIQNTTYILYLIFCILLTFGYFRLLNKFSNKKELVVIVFLSPPLNFLIYQGNLDLIVLITLLFISSSISSKMHIKLIFLFFVAIFEIHPVLILFGFLFLFLLEKEVKYFLFTLFLVVAFIGFLFFDFENKKFSNQYLAQQLGTSTYINDIFTSFGLKLDLIFLSEIIKVNIYFIIFFVSIFIYFFFSKYIQYKINLEKELLPLSIYFIGTIILENPVYRLSIFLILFISLFSEKFLKLNYLILFSLFLNPTPLLEIQNSLEFHILNSYNQFDVLMNYLNEAFNKLDLLLVLLNRLGLYAIYGLLLKYLIDLIIKYLKLGKIQ